MKKVLGLLLTIAVVFSFVVTVNAKTISMDEIMTQVKADNMSLKDKIKTETNSSNSNKLDIYYDNSVVVTVDYVNGVLTFDGEGSSMKDMLLGPIVNSVFKLQNQNKTENDFKQEVKNNSSKYTYDKHKVEARVNGSGNYSYLKIDTNNVNLSSTESNPKTGVFIPVFGISVLIVGSVICLLWIGKNNVFKGL